MRPGADGRRRERGGGRVVVTGATDGIGRALTEALAAGGASVVAVGRRRPSETPFAADDNDATVDYRQLDLSKLWDSTNAVAVLDLPRLPTAVVHNAGLGVVAPPGAADPDTLLAVLEVNLWAPIHLAHALDATADPGVLRTVHLFVSSVMASHPCNRFASYGASKAALEAFAWNLAAEDASGPSARARTIAVLRPGATRTGMHYKSGLRSADAPPRGAAPERVAASAAALLRRAAANRRVRRRSAGAVNTLAFALGPLSTSVARLRATASLRRAHPFRGWKNARVVVTGGASGIGREIARLLAAQGAEVVVADLPSHEPGVVDYAVDLTRREEVVALAEYLRGGPGESAGGVDTVFHCAGISAVGRFGEIPLSAHRAVYEVNLLAPVLLTEELLRERDGRRGLRPGGGVMFFSTLGVRTGYPGAAVYTATKAGLHGYAEGVRSDCASYGIHVCVAVPGPVRTPHARRYSPAGTNEGRRRSPDAVARDAVRAFERRTAIVFPGFSATILGVAGALLPRVTTGLFRRAILDRIGNPLLPPNINPPGVESAQGSFSDQS